MKYRVSYLFIFAYCASCNSVESPASYPAESTLSGIISYNGQIKNPNNHDWCGSELNSALTIGENGQIANAIITLGGGKLMAEIPNRLSTFIVPEKGTILIDGCRFEPATMVITQGGAITIQNTDSQHSHNINLIYHKALVGQANLAPGAKVTMELPEIGFYQLGELRQDRWLAMGIYSTNKPLFDKSDTKGHYSFGVMEPGNYEIQVRHPILGDIDEMVNIGPGEQIILRNKY